VCAAEGIIQLSVMANSNRDHSIFNNGIMARLLQPTAMLPTGHYIVPHEKCATLTMWPFVNIL